MTKLYYSNVSRITKLEISFVANRILSNGWRLIFTTEHAGKLYAQFIDDETQDTILIHEV